MTPEDRAKWCIAQAEALEAQFPKPDAEELEPIAAHMAQTWRRLAFLAVDEAMPESVQ